MKHLDFLLLSDTVALLDIKEVEADQFIKKHSEIQEPEPALSYKTQDDYNLYVESVKAFIKEKEQAIRDARALSDEIKETEWLIIKMLPLKGVWFKLPGSNRWVAKVSTNLCSPGGNELRFTTTALGKELPKLVTC